MRSNLHMHIIAVMKKEISRMQPGERLGSFAALARRFRVSQNTVRTAMMALQADGFVEVRQGSGCFVSGSGGASESENVSVQPRYVAILSDYDILSHEATPFFRVVIRALRSKLNKKGYSSRLYIGYADKPDPSVGFTCHEFLEDLELDRILGVVSIATLPFPDWLGPVRKKGIPLVADGSPNAFEYVVEIDPCSIIPSAVRFLRNRGCREIALLGWRFSYAQVSSPGSAVARFREALALAGLPYRAEWVRGDLHPSQRGAGWAQFREIWAARGEAKPDGLIVTDDVLFEEASHAILEMGVRIPEQLTVVANANHGLLKPVAFPVALYEIDPEEFAQSLSEMICTLITGAKPESRVVRIPYTLHVEDQTGAFVSQDATGVAYQSRITESAGGPP